MNFNFNDTRKKTYKHELSQISKVSLFIKSTIEEHKNIKNLENTVVHFLMKIVVCLVENAQIEKALKGRRAMV
ncbi:hypothetical protein SteCoe_15220 [Stentor coeruleus]|uniref:Uncharacterized protein n=1 Tax=Stentor coeruleus TaxID=5963 RepID=A0A1R2C4A4_9CILI|nr:hypothetical protein SteCoe_15220 [Stentor coeruleus]